MQKRIQFLLFILVTAHGQAVFAQGQDSSPGERYLLVMSELLPGIYDNANQHYFDKRRNLDHADRHIRIKTIISRIEAPLFGRHVFSWVNSVISEDGSVDSYRIVTLSADGADDEVVMRHYFRMDGTIQESEYASLRPDSLRRTEGCDYHFKRRSSQFRGIQKERACRFDWQGKEVYTANMIELSETGLWFIDHKFLAIGGERISGVASGEPYWLERARVFHCYADIPGVGGGHDIPFERYEGFTLHDKGGMHWFTTRDEKQRNIGVVLQSVTWHVLNEKTGNFNRDSLVLYTLEKTADGSVMEHGYAFTEPGATRIGNNMKWMLVNCAITQRNQARPEM